MIIGKKIIGVVKDSDGSAGVRLDDGRVLYLDKDEVV